MSHFKHRFQSLLGSYVIAARVHEKHTHRLQRTKSFRAQRRTPASETAGTNLRFLWRKILQKLAAQMVIMSKKQYSLTLFRDCQTFFRPYWNGLDCWIVFYHDFMSVVLRHFTFRLQKVMAAEQQGA